MGSGPRRCARPAVAEGGVPGPRGGTARWTAFRSPTRGTGRDHPPRKLRVTVATRRPGPRAGARPTIGGSWLDPGGLRLGLDLQAHHLVDMEAPIQEDSLGDLDEVNPRSGPTPPTATY